MVANRSAERACRAPLRPISLNTEGRQPRASDLELDGVFWLWHEETSTRCPVLAGSPLRNGDVIKLGMAELEFVQEDSS